MLTIFLLLSHDSNFLLPHISFFASFFLSLRYRSLLLFIPAFTLFLLLNFPSSLSTALPLFHSFVSFLSLDYSIPCMQITHEQLLFVGDVLGLLLDLDRRKIQFLLNGCAIERDFKAKKSRSVYCHRRCIVHHLNTSQPIAHGLEWNVFLKALIKISKNAQNTASPSSNILLLSLFLRYYIRRVKRRARLHAEEDYSKLKCDYRILWRQESVNERTYNENMAYCLICLYHQKPFCSCNWARVRGRRDGVTSQCKCPDTSN